MFYFHKVAYVQYLGEMDIFQFSYLGTKFIPLYNSAKIKLWVVWVRTGPCRLHDEYRLVYNMTTGAWSKENWWTSISDTDAECYTGCCRML